MTASLVYPRLAPTQLAARWRDLIDQPGLPDRFELDEYGAKTCFSTKSTKNKSANSIRETFAKSRR